MFGGPPPLRAVPCGRGSRIHELRASISNNYQKNLLRLVPTPLLGEYFQQRDMLSDFD
jgi:hypothetical protein